MLPCKVKLWKMSSALLPGMIMAYYFLILELVLEACRILKWCFFVIMAEIRSINALKKGLDKYFQCHCSYHFVAICHSTQFHLKQSIQFTGKDLFIFCLSYSCHSRAYLSTAWVHPIKTTIDNPLLHLCPSCHPKITDGALATRQLIQPRNKYITSNMHYSVLKHLTHGPV